MMANPFEGLTARARKVRLAAEDGESPPASEALYLLDMLERALRMPIGRDPGATSAFVAARDKPYS